MRSAAVLLALALIASPVLGQVTRIKIGNTVFVYNSQTGTLGTVQTIGKTTFTNYSNGLTGTSQQVGAYRYTNWSDGSTGTSTQILGSTYHNLQTRTEAYSGYTSRIGSSVYTNLYGDRGSAYSSTTNRIGTMSFTNYQLQTPHLLQSRRISP